MFFYMYFDKEWNKSSPTVTKSQSHSFKSDMISLTSEKKNLNNIHTCSDKKWHRHLKQMMIQTEQNKLSLTC